MTAAELRPASIARPRIRRGTSIGPLNTSPHQHHEEEAAQEAYLVALQRWSESGAPPNPGAWLTTTAQNKAIDRIRRESTRDAKHGAAVGCPHRSVRPGHQVEPNPGDPDA